MKILLINPPKNSESIAPDNMEPLALEVLAATVPQHEVRILDLRFERIGELPRCLSSFQPRLAGVGVNNTIHVYAAQNLLHRLRQALPDANIVVGGHHPTLVPQDFHFPAVDAVFRGWADRSFPEYVRALETGGDCSRVPGVSVMKGGQPVSGEGALGQAESPDIPLPNRELAGRYRRHYRDELGRRTYLVNTARGCPHRCTFCACWKAAGGRVLVRPAAQVARELAGLPRGRVRVFFADDHTFCDARRAEELCERIRSEGAGRRYAGYARADTVVKHPRLFERWRAAGLRDLTIGVEAARDSQLAKLAKGTDTRLNEEAIRILHRLDIVPFAHLLVDPDFTEEDFDALEDFVNRTNLSHPFFPVLTPLPGTILFEEKRGQIRLPYQYYDFAHATVPTRLDPERFFARFIKLYFGSFSLRRNLRQRLQRLGLLAAPDGRREELPRPVSLPVLAGWHLMVVPLVARLRRHYASAPLSSSAPSPGSSVELLPAAATSRPGWL
jgi:radical SAM superfamily enzyme YgiQ (UPF0313 family)